MSEADGMDEQEAEPSEDWQRVERALSEAGRVAFFTASVHTAEIIGILRAARWQERTEALYEAVRALPIVEEILSNR